ncbi:SOS response-associated peptidase [Flexibacterium corallicola]|uniref:SOS response-associated peptidase n=1 Tax=Flexibacterium corallicola TaxID=3037259 RepID=UPI00286F6D5D|nr:SOS response-associated peptidase [Pseudovibrio sp. M1P-2-3]
MCGRYTLTASPEDVRRLFEYIEQPNFPPRYNICPTQPIGLVKNEHGGRHFALARWGLVPSWVKDPASFTLLINARAETVLEKPSFKNAMKHRRCLIPLTGFYEWKSEGSKKQPYYISSQSGESLAVAGLWETWSHPDGGDIDTAALLTVQSNDDLKSIHHRMPALIERRDFEAWLNTDDVLSRHAVHYLKPADASTLQAVPVSQQVNNRALDLPELIEPVKLQKAEGQTVLNSTSKQTGKTKKQERSENPQQLDLF